MEDKRIFINCEKCGKRLIERKTNGVFSFKFGRDGNEGKSPVEMLIYGSVKMKCIRRSCGYWNTLHFFPPSIFEIQSETI